MIMLLYLIIIWRIQGSLQLFDDIHRTKFLSDDWMEDKGFLEKERNEDHSKFWYVSFN